MRVCVCELTKPWHEWIVEDIKLWFYISANEMQNEITSHVHEYIVHTYGTAQMQRRLVRVQSIKKLTN